MVRASLVYSLLLAGLIAGSSCNHNKIACPTYKDSFPEANNKKKKDDPPALPKASKSTISHSMGPGR